MDALRDFLYTLILKRKHLKAKKKERLRGFIKWTLRLVLLEVLVEPNKVFEFIETLNFLKLLDLKKVVVSLFSVSPANDRDTASPIGDDNQGSMKRTSNGKSSAAPQETNEGNSSETEGLTGVKKLRVNKTGNSPPRAVRVPSGMFLPNISK